MREEARYEYNLNQDSVVLDIGAYIGIFANGIYDRYRSKIFCFEPISEYFKQLCVNAARTNAKMYNFGVGPKTESAQIQIAGDASSIVRSVSNNLETINIRSISEIWGELGLDVVDLIKINIEGMEYDLLDHIISSGLHTKMRNIQVQFHEFENCYARIANIKGELQKTHRQTYCWHMLWENWELCNA